MEVTNGGCSTLAANGRRGVHQTWQSVPRRVATSGRGIRPGTHVSTYLHGDSLLHWMMQEGVRAGAGIHQSFAHDKAPCECAGEHGGCIGMGVFLRTWA